MNAQCFQKVKSFYPGLDRRATGRQEGQVYRPDKLW